MIRRKRRIAHARLGVLLIQAPGGQRVRAYGELANATRGLTPMPAVRLRAPGARIR